jgi:uncharacterized Fe-S cluster-containing radical SAM superfamily enzyme
MFIFDILTKSLFDFSLSEHNSIHNFDCEDFMKVAETAMRQSVKLLLNPLLKFAMNSKYLRNFIQNEELQKGIMIK